MRSLLNIREALRALRANTLRSVLTTLGIIFGVASVIVMVAVGAGTQQRIMEGIDRLGSDTLMVHPGSPNVGGSALRAGSRPTLTDGDAIASAAEIPDITAAAPLVRGPPATTRRNRSNERTLVVALQDPSGRCPR